jgi:protein-S-isoprenylcysteine O-methyltransferase Ste14
LCLIFLDFRKFSFKIQASNLPLILPSLLLSIIGLILWFSSYFYLRTNFSVLPLAKRLITTGPYRFFPHPIYLGIGLTMIGLSLSTQSTKGLLYTLLVCIPLSLCRARQEEKTLKKKFGQKYEAYKKTTLL